jgi:hypothetical protein
VFFLGGTPSAPDGDTLSFDESVSETGNSDLAFWGRMTTSTSYDEPLIQTVSFTFHQIDLL